MKEHIKKLFDIGKNRPAIEIEPRYTRPKIILVDIDVETIQRLKSDGFDVEVGSLGNKYIINIPKQDRCYLNGSLPSIAEKDIIVVDLCRQAEADGYANDEILLSAYRTDYMVGDKQNYFEPSWLYAQIFSEYIKKVVMNGGVLIIFSDVPQSETCIKINYENGHPRKSVSVSTSHYEWMPVYSHPFPSPIGKDVHAVNDLGEIILKDCAHNVCYNTTFVHSSINLINNKLDESIGYIQELGNGFVIFLPQFVDKYIPLYNCLTELIPIIAPEIVPDFVKDSWIHEEVYLVPKVQALLVERREIELEYEKKIGNVNKEIERIVAENDFMTNILLSQAKDDFLVINIKRVLEHIGYNKVVSVDDTIEQGENRQEDLHILDDGRLTLIEVKGHNGNPTEDDCQALNKYISRNMKKNRRTDIHGVLIVNHQKMLPPDQRKNPAFTEAQILDSIRDGYTLVDTWRLYQAVRLRDEGYISFNDINRELHRPGLFEIIPSHWSRVGKILQQYKDKTIACFILEPEELRVGDEIFIKDSNCYFRQTIKEMDVDGNRTALAKKGQHVSILMEKPILKSADVCLITKQ